MIIDGPGVTGHPCLNHPEQRGRHAVTHNGRTTHYCCYCHIERGGDPANWHPACVKWYRERRDG